MRAFCVKCQLELCCSKTGAIAVAMSRTFPAETRACDLFVCPGCGAEIAAAFAHKAYHVGPGILSKLRELINRGARVVPFWMNRPEKRSYRVEGSAESRELRELEPNEAGCAEPDLAALTS